MEKYSNRNWIWGFPIEVHSFMSSRSFYVIGTKQWIEGYTPSTQNRKILEEAVIEECEECRSNVNPFDSVHALKIEDSESILGNALISRILKLKEKEEMYAGRTKTKFIVHSERKTGKELLEDYCKAYDFKKCESPEKCRMKNEEAKNRARKIVSFPKLRVR